jgi:hypothetical protein
MTLVRDPDDQKLLRLIGALSVVLTVCLVWSIGGF